MNSASSREDRRARIAELAEIRDSSGISYVLISHDLAVVRQLTDRIVVMRRGQIVERGATGQVLDHPVEAYTRVLRASVPGPGWKPTLGLRKAIDDPPDGSDQESSPQPA